MCYAIPGRVIELKQGFAVIDYFGEKRKVRNDFFELAPGEYVYAQGGFVIQKVREAEALLSLEAWRELFFELKNIDNNISSLKGEKGGGIRPEILGIFNRAQKGASVSKEEARRLLDIKDEKEKNLLFKTANAVRQKTIGNACCVHGIIEFSNFCSCSCRYCGISRHNSGLLRYRMQPDEILQSVKEACDLGFKALILQSGEDSYYTTEILERLIKTIRKEFGVLIFLSVGERDYDFYSRMFAAGARGALLRFETSDESLYAKIKPHADFHNRLEHLKFLGDMGYLIITGSLLGLPGQDKDSLINDALLAREFGAEMYSFGPFIPHPGTPLKETKIISKDEALKFIAVMRLLAPDAKILVTSALETLGADARRLGLLAGANSFMLNATPPRYKKLYEIYQNRPHLEEDSARQVDEAIKLLKEIGRAPTDLGMA